MPRPDILDQRESLRNPLAGSIALHAGLVATAILYTTIAGPHHTLGNLNAGAGAITIGAVKTIPLPGQTGHPNPVANDTESQVPMPPPEKVQRRTVEQRNTGVPIGRTKPLRPQKEEAPQRKWSDDWSKRANQITSNEGRRVVSQMYQLRGGGSIGIGPGVFGERFGAYAELIAERVAQQWQTASLDPHSQAQAAIVTFDIYRDGTIRNVMLIQRSGNYLVDSTAQRAVYNAAPFPPLPAGFGRDSANVELRFNLK
ncbi:MAG TPA: TonB family protein [Bryobacteraceae bacterium]|nr:TonB family protein [Bryobacteraceae bacterium]